jgi:hypothetical protein
MTVNAYRWEDVHHYFPQQVIEQYRKKIIEEWKSGKYKDRGTYSGFFSSQ